MNPELFSAFLLLAVVLFLSPGPIVTLVIATGVTQGMRAALLTVAGTTLANGLLLAMIAAGLSWLIQTSSALFEYVRFAGAAYLIWLGIQAWRHAGRGMEAVAPPGRVNFRRGFWVALSNPKTIAFFSAFLPQFVDPTLPAGPQLVLMCTASVILGGLLDSSYAIAAGAGRAFLFTPARTRMMGRTSGLVLIGGGIWLALARRAP
jgi:threonine/homoserine/homoserine lactone efflux protein